MLNLPFLTSLIILSNIPSIYGAAGGLQYQVIFSLDEYRLICYISIFNLYLHASLL